LRSTIAVDAPGINTSGRTTATNPQTGITPR
jgi:hypothetical protein